MPRTPKRRSRGNHGLCMPIDSLSTQHTEHPLPLSLNTPSCPSAMSTSSTVNTPSSSVMTYPSDFEARPRYAMKPPRVITREERLDFEQKQMAERVFGGPLINPRCLEQDMIRWSCFVWGMTGSVFEGMPINVQLLFPANYPYVPPVCIVTTALFHPHIDDMSRLWSRVLSGPWWKPDMTVDMVLQHIRIVLQHKCPLNSPCPL